VAWLAEVRAWIEAHVEIAGEIEQPHVRPWATVLRVPTPDGPVWFKAARRGFDHEGPLLELVGPLAPEILPEVLASKHEDGWLLLADAGERARERPIVWAPLLRRYAELQLAATPLADRLLAAGAPDFRPAALPALVEALLPLLTPESRAGVVVRLPEVRAGCELLQASRLAPTLDHGDLHDANVFVRDGHVRILDWGDAVVAHPLLSLTVEMDPDARSAYLAPFGERAAKEELEAVLALRFAFRAVNYARVLPYDRSIVEGIEGRIRLFLAAGAVI
jgi:hypothetical protein